jgi:predicted esterase
MPVTIFHGDEDGIISYSNSKKLKEVLKAKR